MPNQLSIELLRLFAKGELAGTQLQTLAMAIWQDGWGHDDALAFRLAHAGSAGKRRGQVATEVIEAAESLGIICNDSHPYYVKLHDAGFAQMYLPHESVHRHGRSFGLGTVVLDSRSAVHGARPRQVAEGLGRPSGRRVR